ncbi:MAG: aminodeoxychorismate/anthranilate synthase component II [Clostridiales bacterium]|nr:aminodeoxychorismate/anthranilate synthase component II [Clostridiales bacterium]
MIILIDNYDSFSYNLYQLVGSLRPDIEVYRNDRITVEEIRRKALEAILLSPGPGRPEQAGICIETVQKLGSTIPIFGVCLGHQSICRAYGAEISYAKCLMHGKVSEITLDLNSPLYQGMEKKITVGRYHSLAAVKETMPAELKATSMTEDGEIMSVEHQSYPVFGVQYHPESILTPDGKKLMENFFRYVEAYHNEYSQSK